MSRHRDYQPTIDRARSHAEVSERRVAKLRDKADENHREMLRQRNAARIASEECEDLRKEVGRLIQANNDLRELNARVKAERAEFGSTVLVQRRRIEELEQLCQPWWRRAFKRVMDAAETAA